MTITTIPTIDESKSVAVVKSVSMDPIVNTFEKMYGRGAYVNEEPEPGTERTNADQLRVVKSDRPNDVRYRSTQYSNWFYMYLKIKEYENKIAILSTITLRTSQELTRFDLIFEPKFAKKCRDCGYETETMVTECPECGSKRLRRPDKKQLELFKNPVTGKSFLECANNNGQTLKDVIRTFAADELLYNQGYVACLTNTQIDASGHADKSRMYPYEFIVYDPCKVQMLFNDAGEPGRTYAFTLDDRHTMINIADPSEEDKRMLDLADSRGQELYEAYYKVGENWGATGRYNLYHKDEIFSDQWYRSSLTYGVPIWFDAEDDLQTIYFINKHFLKKHKYGYVRKILILPGFDDDSAANIVKGVTDVLATNDNSIPIVCTPPQMSGVAEMQAQALDLGTENAQDALAVKNDSRDRLCALGGAPNLFMGDVTQSGGMNNESQQITVYDRALMPFWGRIDRLCSWFLSWFPGIEDYDLVIDRPTRAESNFKKRMDRIQEAQLMKSMGFDVEFVDGEFHYSKEPVDQVMRRQQEQQAQVQAMMAQQQPQQDERGVLPGDGYGPPEKGTARRENPEIADAMDEIDLAKREAL